MADKSFGDYPNRNIVKNPLLSSAVTGMSLEDLTHNAVLLPVSLSQEVIRPPDEQNRSHTTTLGSTEHTAFNLPAGDAITNPFLQSTSHTTSTNLFDTNTSQKIDQRPLRPQSTQSKASVKSEDYFDVNEYFARLHGTRYVSAPLNSNLKEDKTANLEATEENLEEINLNEPEKEVNSQQSLTADIAQNFSQLPTVLPQMASAMFSSFSNMLQTRKSREATPDVSSGYQEVQFERPEPPMVAPPLREPPTLPPSIGTANYRLPPKKKYAQIPGLSSERISQIPFQTQNQNMPPTHQNTPQYFTPSSDNNQNQSLQNNNFNQSNIPTYFVPTFDNQQTIEPNKLDGEAQVATENVEQNKGSVKDVNVDIFANKASSQPQFYSQDVTQPSVPQEVFQNRESVKEASVDIFGNKSLPLQPQFYSQNVTQPQGELQSRDLVKEANVDIFANKAVSSQPQFYSLDVTKTSVPQGVLQSNEPVKEGNIDVFGNKPPLSQSQFYNQDVTQPSVTLPPPPTFTNLPRRDSQSGAGKSILPPSVARRISSNRPTIKQTTQLPQAPANIFIPTPLEDTVQQNTSSQPAFYGQVSSVPTSSVPSSLPPLSSQIPAQISTPALLQPSADKSAPSTISQVPTNYSFTLSQTIKKEIPPGDYMQPATSVPVSIFTPTSIPSHHQEPRSQSPTVNMPPSNPQGFSQIPTSILSPAFESRHPGTAPLAPASMYSSSNSQNVPPTIFTPQSTPTSAPNIQTSSGLNLPSLSNPSQRSLPPPPTFFTPTAPAETEEFPSIDNRTTPGIDQQKPVPEPPKAVGNVNYRMTKKRPQYYSGPIGGIGDISNNVKPVMPPLQTGPMAAPPISGGFQGDMFSPSGDYNQPATEHIPFDINKPAEQINQIPDPTPQSQDYATAFDFSRPTTENYSEPKQVSQESTGFGLLGSLKSKLTSLDINKIQSTVTTFFDPAYNDAKKESSQPERPQEHSPYEQSKQYQSSNNFEIYVPNVEQTNPNYNQSYLYQMQFQNQFGYSQQQHAHLSHEPHNYYQNQGYHGQHHQSHDQNISNYFGDESHIYQTPIGPTHVYQPMNPQNTLLVTAEGLKQNESVLEIQQTYFANPNYQSQDSIQAQISSDSGSEIKELSNMSMADISHTSLGDKKDIISDTHDVKATNFFDNIPHDRVVQCQPQNVSDTTNLSEQNINLGIASSKNIFENSEPDTKSEKAVESSENVGKISAESLENAENKVIEAITENLEIIRAESELSHKSEEMPIFGGFEMPKQSVDDICEQDENALSLEKNLSIGGGLRFYDSQKNESESTNAQANTPSHQVSPTQPKTDEYKSSEIITTNIKDVMFKLQNNPADFFGTFNQAEISRENSFSQLLIDCKNEISKEEQKKHEVITEHSESSPEISTPTGPLLGLSNMLADKTKELSDLQDEMKNLAIREPSDGEALFNRTANVSLFENVKAEAESDLNICETCREIDRPDDVEEKDDLTTQMIENITSPVLLENAVEVPLSESNADVEERGEFDTTQCEEICQITESTIETIQVKSATELLDTDSPRDYGWSTDKISNVPTTIDECSYQLPSFQSTTIGNEFNLPIDPSSIGFFGNNNLFENITTNIGADLKAEFKDQNSVLNVLSKQMSIPSAPPEEDTKSDVLDVHSIEQDASKDFPIYEEYVIEPSKDTDDEKEDERGGSRNKESFTSRVDKFKNKEDILPPEQTSPVFDLSISPGKKMASYFDTGNYAVETHYRNSLTSPSSITSNPIRVPPGFEEEFRRRMCNQDGLSNLTKDIEPSIPDTTTQTRLTYSPTFTTAQSLSAISSYVTTSLMASDQYLTDDTTKLPDFTSTFGSKGSQDLKQISLLAELSGKSIEFLKNLQEQPSDILQEEKAEEKPQEFSFFEAKKDEVELEPALSEKAKLPDPKNFFGEDTKSVKSEDQGFNRLASYFSSPAKTEHSKSFFELSQSENHYRNKPELNTIKTNTENLKENIPPDQYLANLNLMRDLTSVQNTEFKPDTIVRTVNYFTVEYDNAQMLTEFRIGEPNLKKESSTDIETLDNTEIESDEHLLKTLQKCKHCSDISLGHVRKIDVVKPESIMVYNVRKCMDSNDTEGRKDSIKMKEETKQTENSVTTNFGHDLGDDHNEGVAVASENRIVGEYIPVRHHWFYRVDADEKSLWRGFSVADSKALEQAFLSPDLTDETVVPTDGGRYDVNVKGRLRYAVYWSDKPSNVRRCSWFYKGTTDVRYVPYTESVAETLEEEYRHGMTTGEWHRRLVLPNNEMVVMHGPGVMVHFLQAGTAAAFSAPPQTTSRPRVVRRGYDESEIEESEPSKIDHLLLLCHGVGSACDMRLRNVEEVVDDFRATSLQLIQAHYKNSFDSGQVGRVEVLPISWHATLHSGETGVDKRLAKITLDSIPKLRNFTNDTVLDVLFYTSPVFCQTILNTVCCELNRIYKLFRARNPDFKGGVSLGGHSLGSVILYDLLCHQQPKCASPSPLRKQVVEGPAGTGQPSVKYPTLEFDPDALYALGSPIAIFECIRGVEELGRRFRLPSCNKFFNIFHPYDPIAYRIEPLINSELQDVKPFLIPHHKGRKRMHLELRDTMARVGADIKQKLIESIKSTWASMWKAQPSDLTLEKVVEEELEKEHLTEVPKEKEERPPHEVTPEMLGKLNGGRRVDYVLQEAPLELINEYLFAMSSHVGYWESEDTMLLMLKEIYDSLGVQPDCTVPQANLTVQRTRIQDEIDGGAQLTEYPSTSKGEGL